MRRFTSSIPYTEFSVAYGNFDTSSIKKDRIIIHSIVGTVSSAISRFAQRGTGVSAHYIIGNDGRLWAGLEEYWTAYHAGNYPMNQRSLGIEHEWYKGMVITEKLYQTSAKLVADLCKYYNIPCNRQTILKHKEVTATQCPNEINIDKIVSMANAILNPPANTADQYVAQAKSFMQSALNATVTGSQQNDPAFKTKMAQVKQQAQQIVGML